jgi:hypothetical protein
LLIRIQSLVDYDSNEALNIETWRTSPIEDPQIRKSVNPLSPDAMGFPNLGRLLHELSSFLAPETFRISPKIEAFVSSGRCFAASSFQPLGEPADFKEYVGMSPISALEHGPWIQPFFRLFSFNLSIAGLGTLDTGAEEPFGLRWFV